MSLKGQSGVGVGIEQVKGKARAKPWLAAGMDQADGIEGAMAVGMRMPGEQPIAQLVRGSTLAFVVLIQPLDDCISVGRKRPGTEQWLR